MGETSQVREIFDADASSLSRIIKAVNLTADLLVSELLAREPEAQSGVFKETVSRIRQLLTEAEIQLAQAECSLRIPECLLEENEVF